MKTLAIASAALGAALTGFSAAVLAADGPFRPVAAPEIDGPAGVGAIALLVSAGIVLYRRYSK